MSTKRSKAAAPTDDELGELFQGIGSDSKKPSAAAAAPAPAKARKAGAGAGTASATAAAASSTASAAAAAAAPPADAGDILAELENQLGGSAPSRPHTPRLGPGSKVSPIKTSAAARKSAESTRSSHNQPTSALLTPSASGSEHPHDGEKKMPIESAPAQQAAATGGAGSWWGGLVSTATAAMRQAEAAVKEIQQNEEAKKWAEQVRGINVGALKGFGDEIRSRALPTFTNILHTLAPPISSHERLLIHVTHDLVGYPALDPLVYSVFSRVMAQVEGGDLMVVQRGHEATIRSPRASTSSDGKGLGKHKPTSSTAASTFGWRDGPWWRQADTTDAAPRDLGLVKGLREGTKLCRASADAYAADFLAARGGIEAARQRAAEPVSESNPVRSSDLFLAVQAVLLDPQIAAVFCADTGKKPAASAAKKAGDDGDDDEDDDDEDEEHDDADKGLVAFAISVLDPIHKIHFATVSQTIPARWIRWLDADPATTAPLTPASDDEDAATVTATATPPRSPTGRERVPLEIRDVIESGGVDPREWVTEWLEESLSLAVGVVAQRYVALRMGVGMGGEGGPRAAGRGQAGSGVGEGIGKGKRRDRLDLPGVTEAAKAGII